MAPQEKPDLDQYGISEADIKAYRELLELEGRKKELKENPRSFDWPWYGRYLVFAPYLGISILIGVVIVGGALLLILSKTEPDNFFRYLLYPLAFLNDNLHGWDYLWASIATAVVVVIYYDIKDFFENRKKLKEVNLKIDQKALPSEVRSSCKKFESKSESYKRYINRKRADKEQQEKEKDDEALEICVKFGTWIVNEASPKIKEHQNPDYSTLPYPKEVIETAANRVLKRDDYGAKEALSASLAFLYFDAFDKKSDRKSGKEGR